jgi:hypothetical protein
VPSFSSCGFVFFLRRKTIMFLLYEDALFYAFFKLSFPAPSVRRFNQQKTALSLLVELFSSPTLLNHIDYVGLQSSHFSKQS